MPNLQSKYLGLELKSPIVIASSGLTESIDSIKSLESNGAGAVVIKSIFEEEILREAEDISAEKMKHHHLRETFDYIDHHIKGKRIEEYTQLISQAKKATNIPVIASINCITSHEWTFFAKNIEEAGADALELNIFISPSEITKSSQEIEESYLQIIEKIRKQTSIPIALKISHYFTNLASMIKKLSESGIQGIVLFNRFFSPDIDLDKEEVMSSNVLSMPNEISLPLRWTAIMSSQINCDLAASTGVHSGNAMIKMLLAGANVVQVASTIYRNGPEYIQTMLRDLNRWMEAKDYNTIDDFRGKLSRNNTDNPAAYERMQFMKYFSGIK